MIDDHRSRSAKIVSLFPASSFANWLAKTPRCTVSARLKRIYLQSRSALLHSTDIACLPELNSSASDWSSWFIYSLSLGSFTLCFSRFTILIPSSFRKQQLSSLQMTVNGSDIHFVRKVYKNRATGTGRPTMTSLPEIELVWRYTSLLSSWNLPSLTNELIWYFFSPLTERFNGWDVARYM